MNSFFLRALHLFVALGVAGLTARAEDADRYRPYLRFHSGDLAPLWDVDDMWSLALGANFDRHWGAELGIDFYQRDFEHHGSALGEIGAMHLVPQVRLRQPMLNNRLVPYVLAGVGASILQFNDRKPDGFGRQVSAGGATLTITAGAGLEYFITDNITFGIEAKYFWLQPIDGSVDQRNVDVDLSAPTFTFGLRVYFDENHPRPLAAAEPTSPNRFYFGVRVGGSVLTEGSWTSGADFEPLVGGIGGQIGRSGGFLLGTDLGEHWGAELSADSIEYRVNLDDIGHIGEYGMGVVLANLRYRHPLCDGKWVPYLTAGGGVVYGEFNDRTPGGAGLDVDAKGIHPAVGVGAGIEYFLCRSVSLLADANWIYSWGHEIKVNDFVDGSGDFSGLTFHLGFRAYLFEF